MPPKFDSVLSLFPDDRALSNDDTVDELGHLAGKRSELVDHEHERRGSLGVLALLELKQIFRLIAIEQMLAVMEFGTKTRAPGPDPRKGSAKTLRI